MPSALAAARRWRRLRTLRRYNARLFRLYARTVAALDEVTRDVDRAHVGGHPYPRRA